MFFNSPKSGPLYSFMPFFLLCSVLMKRLLFVPLCCIPTILEHKTNNFKLRQDWGSSLIGRDLFFGSKANSKSYGEVYFPFPVLKAVWVGSIYTPFKTKANPFIYLRVTKVPLSVITKAHIDYQDKIIIHTFTVL